MKIGILRELSFSESRVSLTPYAVAILKKRGNIIYVTVDSGIKSGYSNEEYELAGAILTSSNKETYEQSKLLVKVLPPEEEEINFLRSDHILYCFLNLILNRKLVDKFVNIGLTAIGFESTKSGDKFPIVSSMSKIAGKLSFSIGTELLSRPSYGKGILLGGSPSASRSKVVVIGGGTAGMELVRMASSAGSRVSVFDSNIEKLNKISEENPSIETFYPYHDLLIKQLRNADLVLGSTFTDNPKVVRLISTEMVKMMEKHSVLIDLTISNGGISETSKPTNLDKPVYVESDVFHYCVPNIPAVVPKTSSNALSTCVLPYVLQISENLLNNSIVLKNAVQIKNGKTRDYLKFSDNLESDNKINNMLKDLDPEEHFHGDQAGNINNNFDISIQDDEEFEDLDR
jgi:alanine dehydrogenase